MSQSTQAALEQMDQANTIYEPDQVAWWKQGLFLLLWALEVTLVTWLAVRLSG